MVEKKPNPKSGTMGHSIRTTDKKSTVETVNEAYEQLTKQTQRAVDELNRRLGEGLRQRVDISQSDARERIRQEVEAVNSTIEKARNIAIERVVQTTGEKSESEGDMPKVDVPDDDGYDETMKERLTALETRFDTILPTLATKTDMESIKTEIHKSAGETHKWMIATVIGLFLGFGGLFLAMSNALKPAAPATAQVQQPPIVIYPQAQPTTPAPSEKK